MVRRFWKKVVLNGWIPQLDKNYLPYQVSYLCRQINISWYTFQRSFRSVRDNQLLVTMETIVYMLGCLLGYSWQPESWSQTFHRCWSTLRKGNAYLLLMTLGSDNLPTGPGNFLLKFKFPLCQLQCSTQ